MPECDDTGRIAEDVPCCRCQYNLRTIHVGGACPECGTSIQFTIETYAGVHRWSLLHLPGSRRIWYGLFGILLPLLCFAMSFGGMPWPIAARWQSGVFTEQVGLLLGGTPSHMFYPLLIYSMLCLAFILARPIRLGRFFAVRFGIYTGVGLALQYAVIVAIAEPAVLIYLGPVEIGVVAALVIAAKGKAPRRKLRIPQRRTRFIAYGIAFSPVMTIVGLIVYVARGGDDGLLVFVLMFVPCLTVLTYGLMSIRLLRTTFPSSGNDGPRRVLPMAWLGSYGISWYCSISAAISMYNALPKTKPWCYVSTAAARGHPSIVKRRTCLVLDGQVVPVNRQMRILKCGELAAQVRWPRAHRIFRRGYDLVGPLIARRIRHPLAADLAYLALKPAEWLTLAALHGLLGDAEPLINEVYSHGIPRRS